jgi:Protein of unknown function (DUF1302)
MEMSMIWCLPSTIYPKIKILLLSLLFVFSSLCSFSMSKPNIDWEHQVKIITRAYQDIEQDNAYESEQALEGRLIFENKFIFPDNHISITVDLETRYNAFLAEKTDQDVDTELKDAFIEYTKDRHVLSVGRQTVTWGKRDDDSIFDIINPQDYKLLFLLSKQERKLPAFMFRYDYNLDESQIEAIFMPVFRASNYRYFGSDWALFGQMKKIINDQPISAAAKSLISGIRVEDNDQLYDESFENAQMGLRFRSRIREIDYDIYYMNIYSSLPTLQEKTANGNIVKQFLYEPTNNNLGNLLSSGASGQDLILIRQHSRVHAIGFDLETIVAECGIRAEAGIFLDKPYLRRNYSYVTKDTFSAGLTVDHTTENNFYMSLGIQEDVILSYEDLYFNEHYTHTLTMRLSKDFFRGKLLCSFNASYNASRGDRMFNPKITYKFNNGIDVSIGAFVLEGDTSTTYGRYSDKDLVYLEAVFRF